MNSYKMHATATFCCILLVVLAVGISSCTKTPSNGNDGEKFIGTWTGTSSGSLATLTIVAGGNGNALTIASTAGSTTGCTKTITINLTASGVSILIPEQNFIDNCGVSYVISGSGSLSGNILTLVEHITGGVAKTYNFTGSK